ncbi:MAG: hypothetical protein PVJ08_03370 [Dehalococcoidia bacterium]|jgi:hypothetical protein
MKNKLAFNIVIFLITLTTASLACDGNPPPETTENVSQYETLRETLIAGGIEKPEVTIYEDKAVIRYNEPLDATEKDLISKWVYIMGTTVEEAPWISQVITQSTIGEDAVLEVTGQTDDIIAYLCGETTSEEFLPELVISPVGKGPIITHLEE